MMHFPLLTNGTFEFEGRVDLCLNGVWGTMCRRYIPNQFSDISKYESGRVLAEVVCRQLAAQLDITPFRCEFTYVIQRNLSYIPQAT